MYGYSSYSPWCKNIIPAFGILFLPRHNYCQRYVYRGVNVDILYHLLSWHERKRNLTRKKLSFVSNDWFGNTFLYTFRLLHSLLQQFSDTPIGSVVIGIILCAILTKSNTLSALRFSHNLPWELSALLRLCYIENPVLTLLFVVSLLCPLLCLEVACSERKPSLSKRSSADILLRLSICGLHSNTTRPWW